MDRRTFVGALTAAVMAPLAWLGFGKREAPMVEHNLVLRCKKCGAQYDPISEHERYHAHSRRCGLAPEYLAACAAAGVPEDEVGEVVVAEVLTEHRITDCQMTVMGIQMNVAPYFANEGKLCHWKARTFDSIRKGEVFRTLSPKGERDLDKQGRRVSFRADSDAQPDPTIRFNAGLTAVRIKA